MNKQELKTLEHDQFVEGTGRAVEYVATHRSQVFKVVGAGLAAALLLLAGWWFMQSRAETRKLALEGAQRRYDGVVSATPDPTGRLAFPTADAKRQDNIKAFTDVVNQYDGTEEAAIAHFYLGVMAADQGDLGKAEAEFRKAISDGSSELASIAKLSLSDTLAAAKKTGEAEKVLQELVSKPSTLVSQEQATLALAKLKATSNPAEARKLLEPLRTKSGAVSRAALAQLADLPK